MSQVIHEAPFPYSFLQALQKSHTVEQVCPVSEVLKLPFQRRGAPMQMQVFDHRGPRYGIQDLVKAV